jgi:prepilin-type N-terminal cleavage/methylation domain-containing protein
MKKSTLGFTLVELVVVILIIAVLSVEVMTQSTTTVTPMMLSAAASQVADDIRYTQALSMFSGQRYYYSDVSVNQYSIQNGSGTAIVLANGSKVATLPAGVVFSSATNLSTVLGFTGRGAPITDTSGTLLTATATITISSTSGAYTQTLTISPITGRIVIS